MLYTSLTTGEIFDDSLSYETISTNIDDDCLITESLDENDCDDSLSYETISTNIDDDCLITESLDENDCDDRYVDTVIGRLPKWIFAEENSFFWE